MNNLAAAVELKACAHCAHDRTYFDKDWPSDHVGYYLSLRCSQCKAGTRSIHCYEDDPMVYQELRDLWNTRPPVAGLAEFGVSISGFTQDALKKTVHYDPETGLFTRVRGIRKGAIFGTKTYDGYLCGKVLGKQYRLHRLAWLYVHGEWPKNQIDHINGIRTDNRLCNLRDVTPSINKQNTRKADRDNKTGFLGVQFSQGKYQAQIRVNKKPLFLGTYDSPEEAHAAYLKAKRQYHEGCTI